MGKTFILVTQEAEKLGAKHLPFFLRHPVFIWYVLHESTRILYVSISNVYFLHVLQYLQEVAHANFECPT